jgi:DNA-binding CsgD family transcriptional regulator
MIAYGTAYLAGSYFPFYFYKVYRLKSLRGWATWGAVLFVFMSYLICDVLLYAWNGALVADREWGVLAPGLFGVVVLYVMARAIVKKYRDKGNRVAFRCEMIVWACLLPWELMSLVAFYPQPQWLRILASNLGWVAIALIKIAQFTRMVRKDDRTLRALNFDDIDPAVLEVNSRNGGMSARETEIMLLLRERKSSSEIAEKLFLSDWTVKSHVKNMFKKAGVSSRAELLRKYGDPDFK